MAAPTAHGYVYFACADMDDDAIKIGFTTNLDSRMTTLSTGSRKKLRHC